MFIYMIKEILNEHNEKNKYEHQGKKLMSSAPENPWKDSISKDKEAS